MIGRLYNLSLQPQTFRLFKDVFVTQFFFQISRGTYYQDDPALLTAKFYHFFLGRSPTAEQLTALFTSI